MAQEIIYFGQRAFVDCDRRCDKAWGMNSRPRHVFDDDPDDYVYLPDDQLGEAPEDPGTYEGDCGKPGNNHKGRLNKWCVRECERCVMERNEQDLVIPDMNDPRPNIPGRTPPWKQDGTAEAKG